MRNHLLISLLTIFITLPVMADQIQLNPEHPDRYTVVKGDTLWDIAGKFLQHPWEWDKIWQRNPYIENPDLIYPGDILALSYDAAGNPRLTLERGDTTGAADYTRLSPEIRLSPTREAIPVIPLDAIKQFLTRPRVVTQEEMKLMPYVVGFADEHIIGGAGDRVYVRSVDDSGMHKHTVFREGQNYVDPVTREFLGFEAKYVGDAALQHIGDPATLMLTRTRSEVLIGDRLMPAPEEKFILNYQPRRPAENIDGQIISVLDGVSQIGQYYVVVVNKGTRDGVETGHLFDIYEYGQMTYDTVTEDSSDMVKLPDEKNGIMMIFRPFEKVSYGLVLYTRRVLHVLDRIETAK